MPIKQGVRPYKNQRGLTLVEILVVVAVIGTLAGVLLNLLDIPGTQAEARDASRVSDLKEIQVALELYYSDNGTYPATISDLQPQYINQLPTDPSSGTNYTYLSASPFHTYNLTAGMETDQFSNNTCGGDPCYVVTNP